MRDFGQSTLGVTHRGGVIAVDIAEIPLSVDEGIAHRKILGETNQRVIDRLIAMRMIFADDVADHTRRFLEAGARIEPKEPHRPQHATMNRFESVARIGQCSHGYRRERIGKVALAERFAQLFGTNVVFGVGHAASLLRFARRQIIQLQAGPWHFTAMRMQQAFQQKMPC